MILENNMAELPKQYDPSRQAQRIYEMWQDGGYFKSTPKEGVKPYVIVMPPPNVTGQLHCGHALNNTLQDILIRFHRMRGEPTLWQPGTDHAGIATQVRVEKELRETEGITRHDLGREKFLERVWDWRNKFGGRILEQLKLLGCSCDMSRLAFTMEDKYVDAVRHVFVHYYNKGLIYRGQRIINWCPSCRTALSDSEVNHDPKPGHLWHIRYPFTDGSGYVVITTTRPETMLGDTAVAVNPKDERYAGMIGKTLTLPLVNKEIPIIADHYVEMGFGSGAVKMTPAHDANDFDVGERHNLERVNIMNEDATINENGGAYAGLDRYEARKRIVDDLTALGLLEKIEDYESISGECYRCSTVIEPLLSLQWFVDMSKLSQPAVDVVADGTVKFYPERYTKVYMHWLENIRDWCISRQLWWGHRIPAFYCEQCGKTHVSMTDLTACPDCGGTVVQDEDVLDTWFSSALWPLVTLGWRTDEEHFNYYYPTTTLVTAYEIISLWVVRMIFSGLELDGHIPYSDVVITGLVRDDIGRKMEKSLGNGIDPVEMIDAYGADALRFMLVSGNTPGSDMRFQIPRVESARNFCNKIWNASRFVMMNVPDIATLNPDVLPQELRLEDKWILARYSEALRAITGNLERYEFNYAAENLYSFIWDDFCDWYIEIVKPRMANDPNAGQVLVYLLSRICKLLHPIMPFISEEIYGSLNTTTPLIIAPWDTPLPIDDNAVTVINTVQDAIRAVRNTRAEHNVVPSVKTDVAIATPYVNEFASCEGFIQRLAYAQTLTVHGEDDTPDGEYATIVVNNARVFIPRSQLFDVEAERARLTKERTRLVGEIERADSKLGNTGFTDKAPQKVVDDMRQKAAMYRDMLQKVEDSLAALEK